MSAVSQSRSRRETVDVDIKKVDYTIRDWEDTDDLKQELMEAKDDKEEIINIIEDHGDGIRPVIHILGRTNGGSAVHLRVHGVKPYFYVPYEEFGSDLQNDSKVVDWDKGFDNIQGEHMVKVYTRIPGDVPKLRDEYDHHEADILFPNRFLIDSGIEGSIRIPKEHATPEPTDIELEQIKDSEANVDTRVCFCDIEVDDSKGFPDQERTDKQVISITVYDNYRDEYQILMWHPDYPDVSHDYAKVRMFESEKEMLKAFNRYIKIRNFDCITGWNFEDFDSRYLVNRLETLSDKEEDSDIHKTDISKLESAYDDGYYGAKIKGITVFDMLRAYKQLQFTELDSYSLEDVAQEELGVGKIKDNRGIYTLWKEEPQKLVEYNVKDVELTVRLEEEQDIIKFYEEIANYVGGRLGEVVDASKAVDIKVLRAVNGKWAVPSAKNVETGDEEFEGGEVFDPITGVKNYVAVLDLKSLYPMTMKTINAGPETKDPDGELQAPNGVSFTNEQDAVVVKIIDEMLEEREKYKELRDQHPPDSKMYEIYDRKQAAVKIVMNTLYGVLGWDRFRLKDKDVGASVTATAREVIKFTKGLASDMGFDVVYGDTDSIMIELKGGDPSVLEDEGVIETILEEHGVDSLSELRKKIEDTKGKIEDQKFKQYVSLLGIGYKVEEVINEAYDDFAKEKLNADEHFFEIEFEKLYRRFFQAGKKKRYAGHITWKEGKIEDSLDIVGFEYQRSDYSQVAKELMERVFEHILRGGGLQDIHDDVTDVISKMRNEEYGPDEFGIPASVTKDFDDYDTATTAVKGSRYANENFDEEIRPGDKPKMHYVKRIQPDSDGKIEYPMPDPDGDKTQPCCWMNYSVIPDCVVWDWDKYIDIQIKKPISRILKGTDWSWEEVISGDRKPKLDEYDFEDNADGSEAVTFAVEDEEDDDSEDFDYDDMLPWEREEMEAREQLSNTQEQLDGWDSGEEDVEVSVAKMKEEEGPVTLDQYM